MKVIHLANTHETDDIRIFKKECIRLVETGYEVIYITKDKHGKCKDEMIEGVRIITYRRGLGGILAKIPIIRSKLSFIIESKRLERIALSLNGDLYHIHEYKLAGIGQRLFKQGKKVVYDSHEDSPGQYYHLTYQKLRSKRLASLKKRLVEQRLKRIAKESSAVIATTGEIASQYEAFNSNVVVIHNYANLKVTKGNTDDYYVRKNIICYVGLLYEQRGIMNIIDAMNEIDGEFHFGGHMDERLKQKYSLGLGWEKCKYLGYINRDSINHLYDISRVGIIMNWDIPYHRNSNPNKLFEYMAAGLPIVCTDIPEWKKVVVESKCGICVNAREPLEIADAINYLLDNPVIAKEMGANGFISMKEKYNWEKESHILTKLYSHILAENSQFG